MNTTSPRRWAPWITGLRSAATGLALSLVLFGTTRAAFATTVTNIAVADAFVATGPTGNLSDNNYGGGGALAVSAPGLPNGEFQSVIKFNLSTAHNFLDALYGAGNWSVQSITLRLTSSPHSNVIYNDIAAGLFGVSLMQNNSWVEGTGNASNPSSTGITYNTLQNTFINNALDQPLGNFNFPGGTSGANNYALTLASGLTSDLLSGSLASLRLYAADSSVSYLFSSRAQLAPDQPQLLIDAVPEPAAMSLFAAGLGILLLARRSLARH